MLLTSSYWEQVSSTLWNIGFTLEEKYFLELFLLFNWLLKLCFRMSFPNDNHVEFGKLVQDKVLGTQEYSAHVSILSFFCWNKSIFLSNWQLYDLNTSQLVRTFEDENISNKYNRNMATFHPSDNLILNDGVLWDVRKDRPVHKFDKFNQSINGLFHPNGQEIISSSEIVCISLIYLLLLI